MLLRVEADHFENTLENRWLSDIFEPERDHL